MVPQAVLIWATRVRIVRREALQHASRVRQGQNHILCVRRRVDQSIDLIEKYESLDEGALLLLLLLL